MGIIGRGVHAVKRALASAWSTARSIFSHQAGEPVCETCAATTPPPPPPLSLGVNAEYQSAIREAAERTGLDPAAIASIIDAEAGKDGTGKWNPNSKAPKGSALGLTQFLDNTWNEMATRPGTLLNEEAKTRGFVRCSEKGCNTVPEHMNELLALRTDPRLAIVSAAEYDKHYFDLLSPGLFPPDLSDDAKARYMYLVHHEGKAGAERFLGGTLTDKQADKLLAQNLSTKQAETLIAQNGSSSAAYVTWLNGYMDQKIQPAKFR